MFFVIFVEFLVGSFDVVFLKIFEESWIFKRRVVVFVFVVCCILDGVRYFFDFLLFLEKLFFD